MKIHKNVILLILVLACFSTPALGVDKYVGGSPELSAYISGVNEFSPGQDAKISVIIQNSGTYTQKLVTPGTLSSDDAPTTAKLVTAELSSGVAQIVMKSDPQYLGDLKSPGKTIATFSAKITSDATLGEYQLPLSIHYTYLSNNLDSDIISNTIESQYTPVEQKIPLTIRIKPEVKISVENAITSDLVVGSEGFVNLTIRNIGNEDGKQAAVKILRSGTSAVIPTDDTIYVGDFPKNHTISCQYKVAVSADAKQQTYPIDVVVTYTNVEGDKVTSRPETIGVSVGQKLNFQVSSSPVELKPGETRVITVDYQNMGSFTAKQAVTRLSITDPFTSSDTLAYLGDIPPGGIVTASFKMNVKPGAATGIYDLDTEIRYRDILDNSQISDTFKTPISVVSQSGLGGVMPMAVVLTLVILILIGFGYYILVRHKK